MSITSRDEEDRQLLELLRSRSQNKEVVIFNSFNNYANGNKNFSGADITTGSRKQINQNSSSAVTCSRKRTQYNNVDDILYIHDGAALKSAISASPKLSFIMTNFSSENSS
ncbi:fimbrial protein [Sesbania bispinosa]|nr:fimbrial protein [Sesbania bispinosa]